MKRSLLLLLMLGGCVSAPKRVVVPPAPPPRPVAPPPVPEPPVAWEDRPRTAGDWTYARDGNRTVARYELRLGDVVTPYLSVICDKPKSRTGLAPGWRSGAITITTTTIARILTLQDTGADGGVAWLDPRDPLLDAMIYSRGKFMLSYVGRPDLILPPWPEIARVVEDCRTN